VGRRRGLRVAIDPDDEQYKALKRLWATWGTEPYPSTYYYGTATGMFRPEYVRSTMSLRPEFRLHPARGWDAVDDAAFEAAYGAFEAGGGLR
jgi:hypothetical protein